MNQRTQDIIGSLNRAMDTLERLVKSSPLSIPKWDEKTIIKTA